LSAKTFTPKPIKDKNWRGSLLGVTYTLSKLPEVLGLNRRQLEYQLAVDQRGRQK